jgi:hypothetical protein
MLNVYNKAIIELGFCDNPNYQVSVSVISLSLGSTHNTYLDLDNSDITETSSKSVYDHAVHIIIMSMTILIDSYCVYNFNLHHSTLFKRHIQITPIKFISLYLILNFIT